MFKHLKPSTQKNYTVIMNKILKKYNVKDLTKDEVINDICTSMHNSGTCKNYIIVCKHILKYHDLLTPELNCKLKIIITQKNCSNKTNEKTEKEEKAWITSDQLDELKSNLLDFHNTTMHNIDKRSISKKELDKIQQCMILFIYTGSEDMPPRRNELALCRINYKGNDYNSVDLESQELIFNVYKTSSTYGSSHIKIPDNIFKLIKDYLYLRDKFFNFNTDFLFLNILRGGVGRNRLEMSTNSLTKYLNKIFGGNISSSMLRKIQSTSYAKNIELDELTKLKERSKKMGHSLSTHIQHYLKS